MKKVIQMMVFGVVFLCSNLPLKAQPPHERQNPLSPYKQEGVSYYGSGVSMDKSGKYLAIGSSGATGKKRSQRRTGKVCILEKDGMGYYQRTAQIFASDATNKDGFGVTVAMESNGKYLVVGATGDDDNGSGSGSVYVFENQWGEWKEVAKLLKPEGKDKDLFGRSIAVSDNADYIVVGAPVHKDYVSRSGSVHIYSKKDNKWEHQVKLSPNIKFRNRLGCSVAIDGEGKTVIVGAKGFSCAYVFERESDVWTEKYKFSSRQLPYAGKAVAINADGTLAVIGAKDKATFIEKINGKWQKGSLLAPKSPNSIYRFGESVDVSGDGKHIIVGAIGARNERDKRTGGSFLFSKKGNEWEQQKILFPKDKDGEFIIQNRSRTYGNTVAISSDGSQLAIGDYRFSGIQGGYNVGAVYVYNFPSLKLN